MAQKEEYKTSKFGHYKTSTGGGEPMGEWSSKYPAGGRGVWKEKYDEEPKRAEGQPRTDDGKFTYNAVNGKPLKEISKVNGHSRGTTISPEITGGENGVHYYKDKYHTKRVDGEIVHNDLDKVFGDYDTADSIFKSLFKRTAEVIGFDGKVKYSAKDFIEIYQEYDAGKGKYVGEDVAEWKSKVGRHSTKETEAIKRAELEGTKGSEFVETKDKDESDKETGIKTRSMETGRSHRTIAPHTHRTTTGPTKSVSASAGSSSSEPSKAEIKKAEAKVARFTPEEIKEIGKRLDGWEDITLEDIESLIESGDLTPEDLAEIEKEIRG